MKVKGKNFFAILSVVAILFALLPAKAGAAEIGTAALHTTHNVAGEPATYTVWFTLARDLQEGDRVGVMLFHVDEPLGLSTFAGVGPDDVWVHSSGTLLSSEPGGSYEFANITTAGATYLDFEVTASGGSDFNPGDVININIFNLTNEDIPGDYFARVSTQEAGFWMYTDTNAITITTAYPAVSGNVERVSPKDIKAMSLVELKFTGVEDEHGNPVEGAHEVFIRGSTEIDPWFNDSVEFAGGEAVVWFPMGTVGDFPAAFALVDGMHMGFFEVYVSPVEVIAVAELDEIDVEFGTPFASIPFPDKVEITTDADLFPELEVDVNWQENPDYNHAVAGKYGFAGELQLVEHAFGHYSPGLMKNPDNLMAEITVVVAEEVGLPPVAQQVDFFINEIHYLIDGEAHLLDAPPFIENGRTFIPVRFLAEALGAQADWGPKDALTAWVTVEDEERLVTINIGEYLVTVFCKNTSETEEIIIDVAAMIRDGRTFLPFRAVAEAFGADVGYATDTAGYVKNVWFTR